MNNYSRVERKSQANHGRFAWSLIIPLVGLCNFIMIVLLIRILQVDLPFSKKVVQRPTKVCNKTFDVDVRVGRWDNKRTLKMIDHALVGDNFSTLSYDYPVCLATQTSLDKLDELIDVVEHWNASISAAVLVAGNDEYAILQQYVQYLRECFPAIKERVSFQIAFPKERIPKGWCYREKRTLLNCKKPEITLNALLQLRSSETMKWRSTYWYPQNHMRNLARKNCQSDYVFLTDIDIIPSIGMAEEIREFLKSHICEDKCAYVIPTYEMSYVAKFPKNKYQLLKVVEDGFARPYHFRTFYENQAATDFPKWQRDTISKLHVSYEVKDVHFPYEPFYMAPDAVPPHDERFVGYGYTKSTQVFEMSEAGWRFYVLSPVFTIHWGLADDRQPLWREVQYAYNREQIQHFKREARMRYQKEKRQARNGTMRPRRHATKRTNKG